MLDLLQTPVTAFFLVINVLVGLYSLTADPEIISRWAFRPAAVRRGEWERWLTAGFVHTGFGHLAFNMITLFFFGPYIEATVGWWRFLVVYVGVRAARQRADVLAPPRQPGLLGRRRLGRLSRASCSRTCCSRRGACSTSSSSCRCRPSCSRFSTSRFSVYASNQQLGRVAHEAHLGGALGGIALTLLLYPRRARHLPVPDGSLVRFDV